MCRKSTLNKTFCSKLCARISEQKLDWSNVDLQKELHSKSILDIAKEIGFNDAILNKPSKEELQKLLWSIPTTHIGKMYSVSSNAVGNWAKRYGLDNPGRGYWTKR